MAMSVLVVEDEFIIAEDLRLSLLRRGWSVVGPASDVKTGLRLLLSANPVVAVLDMQLGKELVTPLAQKLRDLDIPFVVTSGFDTLPAVGGDLFKGAVHILIGVRTVPCFEAGVRQKGKLIPDNTSPPPRKRWHRPEIDRPPHLTTANSHGLFPALSFVLMFVVCPPQCLGPTPSPPVSAAASTECCASAAEIWGEIRDWLEEHGVEKPDSVRVELRYRSPQTTLSISV